MYYLRVLNWQSSSLLRRHGGSLYWRKWLLKGFPVTRLACPLEAHQNFFFLPISVLSPPGTDSPARRLGSTGPSISTDIRNRIIYNWDSAIVGVFFCDSGLSVLRCDRLNYRCIEARQKPVKNRRQRVNLLAYSQFILF